MAIKLGIGAGAALLRGVTRAARRSPAFVRELGNRLGVTGGVSSIRSFIQRHPSASFIGLTAAYALGESGVISIFEEELGDVSQVLEDYASDEDVREIIGEVVQAREKFIHMAGDGNPDTTSGISNTKWRASAVMIKEATDRIDRLVGILGSVSAVEELFYGLKALEPEHFEVYRMYSR